MNTIRAQREALWTQLRSVEQMLAQRAGDSLLMRSARRGLEQQKLVLERELEALEAQAGQEPERAHVEMTFRGAAVVGSEGIEANFAGVVAQQYPSLVRAMRRKNFPRKRGTAQQPPEPRLLLTGTARGSFGLVFDEEAIAAGDEAETPLHHACEQVAELLEEVTSAEAPLEVFLGLPATVQKPLKGLLSACKEAGVSMRVSSARVARGWRELETARIEAAATAILEAVVSSAQERRAGLMVGLNPMGQRGSFALRVGDELIEGSVALTQDEEEASALAQRFSGRACWALVSTTTFERQNGREIRHVLLNVASSEEELELAEEQG